MRFEDFIKNKQVKSVTKDPQLAKSIIEAAESDLKFMKSLEINELSARKIMGNYYDILRSFLEAIAILDGFKIYGHEAFTFFLKYKNENLFADKFDRFRKIRNSINYYGKNIPIGEVKENSTEIIQLINKLKNKFLKNA